MGIESAELLQRAESLQDLQKLAAKYKDIIQDPDKNLGRFSKDDKNQGLRNCDEKTEWATVNRDTAGLEQIIEKSRELDAQLKPTMDKLSDDYQLNASVNKSKK